MSGDELPRALPPGEKAGTSGPELSEVVLHALGKPGPLRPALSAAGIELFMTQLAEIAPDSAKAISPHSDLIADLGFESLAFNRLGLLLYEYYGVGGFSRASMRSIEHLTVEGIFRRCVLDVLGI